MKLLNHKPVGTADQRLRGVGLEPSHFRLTIYYTIDLGLTTFLSLNRPLSCW